MDHILNQINPVLTTLSCPSEFRFHIILPPIYCSLSSLIPTEFHTNILHSYPSLPVSTFFALLSLLKTIILITPAKMYK
jgi:hypothetical protein